MLRQYLSLYCRYQTVLCELSEEFKSTYDKATDIWVRLWKALVMMCERAKEWKPHDVDLAKELEHHCKWIKGVFWGQHLQFFMQMTMAAKVDKIVKLAQRAIKEDGMCVVIGLQSTGEAATNKSPAGNELISVAKSILTSVRSPPPPPPPTQPLTPPYSLLALLAAFVHATHGMHSSCSRVGV
jgi:hypothetical protein